MGLDDSRFPGPTLQDPILLDSERVGLSSELPTAAGRLRRILAHFARLLARLRGDVTLSFSSRSLGDDRETFPSNLLLSVFRIISGDRDGDQTALMQWLGAPASFAPDVPEKCLDECEWWLWRLCGREKVSNATELVLARFPHLARGLHAQTQRESQSFTAFDGHVPVAGADLNPHSVAGPPVSASMLETVGRCPLAYFFRHALRVRPLEELTVDQDRWLDALAFGSLLHEVFRRFMTELRDEGKLPDLNRDQERLQHTLRQEIAKYRDLYPPPNEGTYRDQCRQLERAAQIFLMDEHELCKTNVPMFMEASIGLPSDTATALDQAEPVIILVGNGESIRVRGRIDRIDRVGGENSSTFTIWDYKTGSSARYQKQDPFRQGRMIQHILYLAMAEAVLRRKVDPKAIVQSFGYFFPGARGWGQRIVWSPDEIRQGQPIVQRLCQSIARGAFLPTDNSDDCSVCDDRAVCGDFEAVTKCSKEKRSGTLIVELESFRALRANGKEQ
jgi:ATP-dependent helicase/nuclease subunit B